MRDGRPGLREPCPGDDVGVVECMVLHDIVEMAETAALTVTLEARPTAVTWYQVMARDAAGNSSSRRRPQMWMTMSTGETPRRRWVL